jgi:hypothetical protein
MTTGNAGEAGTTPAGPRPRSWLAVTREVAVDHVDQAVFFAVGGAVGFGYSVLLPFDFTQRISFANWHYLDARYVAFTLAFALGMAWVLTLQVHAMRRIVRNAARDVPARNNGPIGALAALVSLLPSFLCCSPVVPTVVGLFGFSAATRLNTTGSIQYFFATKQNWLLYGALALLVASGLWSTHKLARAECLAESCCPAADVVPTATAATTAPPPERPDPEPAVAMASGEHERDGNRG